MCLILLSIDYGIKLNFQRPAILTSYFVLSGAKYNIAGGPKYNKKKANCT